MRVFVGTSGYSYKEWKGSFYPDDLSEARMLSYYAERFRTVEINNTFYRMPSESVLSRWAAEVPDGFTFVLKAPRRITHEKRLKDVEEDVGYLVKTASVLGKKLGPLLFQFPPFLRKDLPKLQDFLKLLPKGHRTALEFRHASWFSDDLYETLRSHDAALCFAETDDEGEIPRVPTASWGYLRLRRKDYGERELRNWAERIRGLNWDEVFVFFKHEDEGIGPKLASRFIELCG